MADRGERENAPGGSATSPDPARTTWLLTKAERGNPRTVLDNIHPGQQAWSTGNHVRPLVHGATYFAELKECIERTRAGDLILFTDWRGDPDEQLTDDPASTMVRLLGTADRRGVDVRGLIWRSHWDKLSFSGSENRKTGEELQSNGAEALLDMRVRTGGSHHQKLVVIRYAGRPDEDIAFVGGIDLCHSRRDDARHLGDPQAQSMADAYGERPAWHDIQAAISGPAVYDVETVFRERWTDPTPLSRSPIRRLHDRLAGDDLTPDPLPEQAPPPAPVPGGTHIIQLLRTYPNLRHGRDYPFARGGERSVARGYTKAIERAERLIYIEDQYLWSTEVAVTFADALRAKPELRVIAVLPHVPDQSAPLSRVPQELGRHDAVAQLMAAGPGRVAVYGIENHQGLPVYVHAKVCVIDDWWATIGSDNFNRRSWTHDSELSAVVLDTDGGDHSAYARRLRLTLAAEHLDRRLGPDCYPGDISVLEPGRTPMELDDRLLLDVMADCIEPLGMFQAYAGSGSALQSWHDAGRRGERPPGRLRPLRRLEFSPITRAWAEPVYRTIHDPDGRPRALRRRKAF
ncbi:MAG TPA: phospholipase D-like domain-containing protein [Microlunatus sp.]|nr:phospholipase D-like domain-containing protein [Microlunatus sp.]